MIIAIVLMAEAWILNLSYAFVDEQSVINYVSFASTITSLILAILAIIYGFYQSENGKKSNAALESNIDSLQVTQRKFDEFVQSVDMQLESINDSALNLKDIGSTFKKSVDKIEEVNKAVLDLKENHKQSHADLRELMKFAPKTFTPLKSSNKNLDDDFLENIFAKSSNLLDLMGVLLVAAYDYSYEGDIVSLAIHHFSAPLCEIIDETENKDDLQFIGRFESGSLTKYVLDILRILNALGVVGISGGGKLEIKQDLVEKIRKYADKTREKEFTKEFADKVCKSFDK